VTLACTNYGVAHAAPAAGLVARYVPATIVTAMACNGFALLVTPTGRLPSPGWRWWAGIAYQAAFAVIILALMGAAGSLVGRFRRAHGVERQQLRWVAGRRPRPEGEDAIPLEDIARVFPCELTLDLTSFPFPISDQRHLPQPHATSDCPAKHHSDEAQHRLPHLLAPLRALKAHHARLQSGREEG
jgi:hypothetical protein